MKLAKKKYKKLEIGYINGFMLDPSLSIKLDKSREALIE